MSATNAPVLCESPDTAQAAPRSVGRDTACRAFLGARTVSILGDRMADLVVPFLLLDVTGSAAQAGVVGAANHLPAAAPERLVPPGLPA